MIDPGWLGSVGPIVAATGAGLLIRRGLAKVEARQARRAQHEAEPAANPETSPPRPRIRMSTPAAARR